jgi:Tfp pilus assembly protein FimT
MIESKAQIKKSFSLIELIVVGAILLVLAFLSTPNPVF